MFPDKVDKVVLDGVQNPHEYYHSYAYVFITKSPEFMLLMLIET